MRKIVKSSIISWILGIALLVAVWRNAHWSVALCLTLIAIGCELNTITIRLQADQSRELLKAVLKEDR